MIDLKRDAERNTRRNLREIAKLKRAAVERQRRGRDWRPAVMLALALAFVAVLVHILKGG